MNDIQRKIPGERPCFRLENYSTAGPDDFGAIKHPGRVFADMMDVDGVLIRRAVVACCQNMEEAEKYCREKNDEVSP